MKEVEAKTIASFDIYVAALKKNSVYFHWKIGKENLYLIDMAIAKGAYVITSEKNYQNEIHQKILYVPSVRTALRRIAIAQRQKFKGEVIAVTGSVGKSSVKNMLADVLQMTCVTIYTMGNENAFLGIFCALCNITDQTQYVVLETGASGPKSLSLPIQVVKPTISILLDVNWSHQEKYQNFAELLKEKASIINALDLNGKLIIHEGVLQQLKKIQFEIRPDILVRTVSEQKNRQADYQILNIDLKKGATDVQIQADHLQTIHLNQSNYANGINAVYSWAICEILGVKLAQFNSLIAFYKPLPRRFERIRVCDEKLRIYELIDDAYNASPISTISLMQSLSIRQVKRKILVLGDMLELGEDSHVLHQEVMQHQSLEQFDQVLVVGEIYKQTKLPAQVRYFESLDDLTIYLQDTIRTGDLVALKASNGMNFFKLRRTLEKDAVHLASSITWFIEDEFP